MTDDFLWTLRNRLSWTGCWCRHCKRGAWNRSKHHRVARSAMRRELATLLAEAE